LGYVSILCALPLTAAAQTVRLSLPQALERASQRAPELVLAEQQIREVGARRAGAGIIMPVNPRLQVEVRPPFTQGKFIGDLGYAATIDSNFDLGGAPAARVREVERDVELASAQRNLQRVSARLRVVAAYLGAQLADLRAREARAGMELAQRVLDAAQKRIEAGAGSDFERSSAQLELTRVATSEEAALRERDAELMALRDGLDITASSPLELTTNIEEPPPLAAVSTYLEAARKHHPALVVSAARVRSLQATRERLERETFPRLGVFAGVDAAPKSPVFGMLGVSGELPVAQRNQGPRAVVAAELETERARRELRVRQIEREVTEAYDAHERRRRELTLLTQDGLPAATRSFELAEAGWKAGRFDWFRVALAARDLVDVRAQRIEALAALWEQRVVLARAKGGDVP
jgi:cobalt-zinc-cadmium efflux system outer membrane protein